jgi:hypothetical protein
VLDQFLHHPIDTRDELLEAYMVGNRLVKFLSSILPTHGDYYTQGDVTAIEARERSQGQVSVVAKYLDQIALLIDKQEHEDYISSVLCQHQEEKSNKIASLSDQQREHMYYSDDTDDDRNDINKYLTTIATGGSDSTERLNNTSTSSACNTVDSSDQHRRFQARENTARSSMRDGTKYRDTLQDSSMVSDSVDLLLECPDANSRNVFLSEDPASTPSHTILRVSPTNETKPENHATRIPNKNVHLKTNQMPIVRSHWVANQSSKQNANTRALNSSFSSVERNHDNTESLNPVESAASSSRSPERSPGGSVRSIIRSWPPKQDPPGVNIDSRSMASSSSMLSAPSVVQQHPRIVEPVSQADTVKLRFQPLSDLQRRAAELDKDSPSRGAVEPEPIVARHKWSDVTGNRIVSMREPSLGSSRVRFSSSSCSSSSRERSTTDDESLPNESLYTYANMNTSPEKELSPVALSSPVFSLSNTSPTTEVASKSRSSDLVRPKVLNFSPDRSDFPTPSNVKVISRVDPIVMGESTIRNKSPNSSSLGYDNSFNALSASQTNRNIITPISKASESASTSFANFGNFSDIGSHQTVKTMLESADGDSERGYVEAKPLDRVESNASERRGSGPVDLDMSTTSTDAFSETEDHDGISTMSRGFMTDGIDYVLPLPRSSSRKSSPVIASYAPSAADWSMEEPDMENQRFERQNSTISIDSTEFGTRSANQRSHGASSKFRPMKFADRTDEDPTESPDWANEWTRFDSSPVVELDGSQTKTLNSSDMSYKMTSMNDSMFSKSTDVRKNFIPKRVHGGPSHADRTTSTGSSSSTPSKDPSQYIEPLSSKASQLLDPFLSRTPIEAPFMLDEEETPFMIDSKTEQRLRVSMKSPADLMIRSANAPSLNLAPNSIGLYGSLKEFQSLDCTVPFDDDATNFEDQSRGHTRSGNPLLCRSRPKTWSDQRSPNEDDWEDSSLLMARNHNSQNFKSCVRCLLT